MRKERKNIVGSKYIGDKNGTLKVKEQKVMERWRTYFSSLLNEYQLEEEDKVEGPLWVVTKQIVEQALKSMKVGKAPGPSGVTSDLIKAARATGVKELFQICKSIEQDGKVPEQWAKSYTILVYKGKRDVLMVDKHRGVRLLEQDMEVYEKTLEKRLRIVVKIDEKQFEFQSGKSTVDAILICITTLARKVWSKEGRVFLCLC